MHSRKGLRGSCGTQLEIEAAAVRLPLVALSEALSCAYASAPNRPAGKSFRPTSEACPAPKDVDSFARKASTPSEQNPDAPKYKDPISEITDLAAVRVITFFPRTVGEISQLIQEEFEVIERVDHTVSAEREERLGYLSVHYLVRLAGNRNRLSEYRKYVDLTAEIQVRTVLQHAWAEIEHDIRYKSPSAIPHAISRRFMALAGLLEIADREFEAIQAEDDSVRTNARTLIREGKLNQVELTADALHSYLDIRLGPDDRISDFTYEWMTKILRAMGFQNLQQVDECIHDLDHDRLSRIALGGRSGQVSRFEVLLALSTGDLYIKAHPWCVHDPDGGTDELSRVG